MSHDAATDDPAARDGGAARSPGVLDLVLAFGELRRQNARVMSTVGAQFGVAVNDFRALAYIHRTPDATPKRVAEYLELTTGALTTLVDRLEKAQLVRRVPHPSDRRSVLLETTPRGAAAIIASIGVYENAFSEAIDREQVGVLYDAFLGVTESLRRLADSRGASPGAAE